ncbi:site-specific DNA-methyltransferase [Pseudoalteromonas sp. SG43-7]|uniref:site-specific DNA-methyltransferase n=1 Tax=Pseudoalteromonas sp. SG43-7 TaxID=2760966 RepID=UPI002175FDBA|nr:site-specific DNA-methyltransferase [Pseudoalteromonas sp. SG43-7]
MKSTMEQISNQSAESKSLDITDANIEQLKQIFPDVFSEGKVDFDALKAVLGEAVDDSDERYNFTWNGKNRARQIAQTPSTGTLRPCKEDSVNWDSTENLFIEGDNLEVLKLLQKSYHKKVKVIYIDVPYNTGKDFVYKDNFHENIKNYFEQTGQVDSDGNRLSTNADTSGRYHSDWISMIYPRLKLARNLLKEDGVIFISIDDVEQKNLRAICDEVFGEDNFVSNLIWQKKFARANDARYFSTMHDHILCYAKSTSDNGWTLNLLPRGEEVPAGYGNPDNDPRGIWTSVVLSAKSGSDKLKYQITTPSGRECFPPDGRYWSVNPDRFKELVEDGRIWFGMKGDGTPRLKTFLSEVQDGLRPNSIWFHKDVGHNQEGRQELKKLFDDKGYFDGPKPTRLIEHIIKIASKDEGDIVLDFFAGSSTTAHAVCNLNNIDDVRRKFIMVQLPEVLDSKSQAYKDSYRTIADISFDRIKRVTKIYPNEGCKYFKLDETNIRRWDADFDELAPALQLAAKSIKTGREPEDVLYEILLKYGIELTTFIEEEVIEGKQVFVVGVGALIVCLDDDITEAVVEGIAALIDELEPESTQVVFKDEGFANDDNVKTNAVQILKQHGVEDVKSI